LSTGKTEYDRGACKALSMIRNIKSELVGNRGTWPQPLLNITGLGHSSKQVGVGGYRCPSRACASLIERHPN